MPSQTVLSPEGSLNSTQSQEQVSATEVVRRKSRLQGAKIMMVDDEPINVKVTQKYLSLEGFDKFVSTSDSREAMALLEKEQPDLVLLDIMMPHISGLQFLAAVRSDDRWAQMPVVILTAAADQNTKRQALELGATDFLGKPVDPTELIPRIRNVLTVKRHSDQLREYSQSLEQEVLRRTAELTRSRQEVIHCLARAAEFRDDDTGRHVIRIGRYSRLIAVELGWQRERLDMLELAAQLHDIGKIGIPDAILRKPGKLAPEELALMRTHSAVGSKLTQSLADDEVRVLCSHTEVGSRLLRMMDSPILAMAATISASHHEKWDGTGYPLGLKGQNIPLEGRIVAVADVFDALSTQRPYKPAFPLDKCFETMEQGRGKFFDPEVLDAFVRRRDDVVMDYLRD